MRANPGYRWKRDGRSLWLDVTIDGYKIATLRVEPGRAGWYWSLWSGLHMLEDGDVPTRRAAKVFALSALCRMLRESLRKSEKAFFAVQPEEDPC